jgi:hypothetical protein
LEIQKLTFSIFVPILIMILVTFVMVNPLQLASSLDPSQTSPSRNRPAITLNEDNVFVIWPDNKTSTGKSDIYLAKSIDGGVSFKDVLNLSNTTGRSANPELIISGTNIYVTWLEDLNNSGNWEIFFKASNDNGTTFNKPINISDNKGLSEDPEIAADEKNIILTWWDNSTSNGDRHVMYRASTDNGTTFDPILTLNATTGITPSK